jgi:4-amino-4-deoxy-L-arabinose transferase-like glycosyltransferase
MPSFSSQFKHSSDLWWIVGLLLAATLLLGVNLGDLPLRDWDEGTVAQVAREIYRAPLDSLTWLYPTLWGEPYLNKPPLVHGLMAIAYHLAGVSEWTSRLPGALLTTLSVPLLYWVGRELFPRQITAGLAAAVYLTMLPVVRHGRLAMLDGAVLCFALLTMGCLVRSRRDVRYALGVGVGLGLVGLAKGVMLAVLFGAISLGYLLWDTPRLLKSPYLWFGLLLGALPLGGWYLAQGWHYGAEFSDTNLLNQSARRIWAGVEGNAGPPWYYLLELLKYGWPWLVFLPLGLRLTWQNRNLGWSRLVLVWGGVYLGAISLMVTKLPWYILPLYPPLALALGTQLTVMWDQGRHGSIPHTPVDYSRSWIWIWSILAIASLGGTIYCVGFAPQPELDIAAILAILGLTLLLTAGLMLRQNPQFIPVLLWGAYLTLLMLMISPHWLWELAEDYPVKPVAAMIQANVPAGDVVYTSNAIHRPSLNFYSDRRVIPATPQQLQRRWQRRQPPYFLLDEPTLKQLTDQQETQRLGQAEGWTLITRPLDTKLAMINHP